MENRHNFYQSYRLHECAAQCEPMRKQLEMVYFKGEYAYASDGKVLVRARIEHISNFTPEEIAMLDGKYIPARIYKKIICGAQVEVKEDGIEDREHDYTIKYRFADCEGRYPDVERIIQEAEAKCGSVEVSKIGISANRMNRLCKAMNTDYCAAKFSGEGSMILVRPLKEDKDNILGILMPILLD